MLWFAAIVLTMALAVFQRMSGPTHPLRGKTRLGAEEISYRLLRSHGGEGGLPVGLEVPSEEVRGTVQWRRFPTQDQYSDLAMVFSDNQLQAEIPHQLPAAKVEYRIVLQSQDDQQMVPAAETVVARFKGAVPKAVLVPHILGMFMCMLLATRALLEVLVSRGERGHGMVIWTMGLLVAGGLILGPCVQKFAFGAFWTGWPFGTDLTDNKTLLAFLCWLPATILAAKRMRIRLAVIVGWVVMMGIFMIPHSLRGSQLDWSEQPSSEKRQAPTGEGT